jgi:outer membrane protein OmpA-like peptidoglycan-associated protein
MRNTKKSMGTTMKRPLMLLSALALLAAACGTTQHVAQAPQPMNWTGPQGPAGATGAAGARGETGAQGATGIALAGPAGAEGATGPSGPQGPAGATGAPGRMVMGRAGETGPTGATGMQGATGDTGAQGASLPGPQGERGRTGREGAQGMTGSTGAEGPATVGQTELAGVSGPSGARGARGAPGDVGARGLEGPMAGNGTWSVYRDYTFASDSDRIARADSAKAGEIATYAQNNPTYRIGIDGRDDRRVDSVRGALIGAGVPAERIQVGTFGDPAMRGDTHVAVLMAN